MHQIKHHNKGGGVLVYINKNFKFEIRNDLSINHKDIESIGVELLYEKRMESLFNTVNFNLLDHDKNKKFQDFFNLVYQSCMILTINESTSVNKKTATAIDHIITNSFVENNFKTAIIKSIDSDHFPIPFVLPQLTYSQETMLPIKVK